ncbi:MAG: PAS domain-containing protein [Proteobacteria bacterium]|nr:PAS domain-containing protein [Pseudomonadota bacterium]
MMPVPREKHRVAGRAATQQQLSVAEDGVATFLLDHRGMIRGCNGASEHLFGYRRGEVVWRHISALLPQLADTDLVCDGQLNPRLLFLCRIGGYFRAQKQNGESFASDLYLLNLSNPGSSDLRMIVRPFRPECANQISQ